MNKMPKVILSIMLLSALLIAGCSPSSTPTPPPSTSTPAQGTKVGDMAPDFQLPNLEGQSISLSDFRGRPVLINFWASWCDFCKVEMPYIQEVYEEWSDKGLVVLAINIGESSSKVEKFMKDYSLSFPALLDTKENVALEYKYPVYYKPTTFFIDKDGIIRDIRIGAFPNREEIEKSLAKIMSS